MHRSLNVFLASSAAVCSSLFAQQFDDGFGKQHLPYHPGAPTQARPIDFDSDGDADLLVSLGMGQLRLWRNVGGAVYEDATTGRLPSPGATQSVGALAVADVDGDQDEDFVCMIANQTRLFLNNGGVFVDATAGRLPATNYFSGLAFGDIDNDGDYDLVGAAPSLFSIPGAMIPYRNNGAGVFTAIAYYPSYTVTARIELVDFDRDGRLDCLLAGSTPTVLFGEANGTFTTVALPSTSILNSGTAADITGDGAPDALFCSLSDLIWCEYATNRTFLFHFMPIPNGARAIGTVDADADGDLDVVLGHDETGNPNALYLNNGTGGLTRSSEFEAGPDSRSRSLLVADLDGNGHRDVLLLAQRNSHLYLNGGLAGLHLANRGHLSPGHTAFAGGVAEDFDGDGDRDVLLLTGVNYSWHQFYRNDGTGQLVFDATAAPPLQYSVQAVASADLDGDGDFDVAIASQTRTQYLINDGTGHFALRLGTNQQPQGLTVAAADVDGDGDNDVLIGGSSCRLELNDGQGNFTLAPPGHLPALPETTRSAAAGDVDGDGDADFVLGMDGQDVLLRNSGAGTFLIDAAAMPTETISTHKVLLADFDGDGDLDVYQANYASTGTSIDALLWNTGNGQFSPAAPGTVPTWSFTTTGAVSGDIDCDGDQDIVLSTAGNAGGVYRLLRNEGGVFVEATAGMPRPVYLGLPVLLADLDRDGDNDLVLTESSQSTKVHANLHRQLRAPHLALRGRQFTFEITAWPPSPTNPRSAALVIGWQLAAAPIAVPPFGTFFLAPNSLQDLIPWVGLDASTGRGSYTFVAPIDPAFTGFTFHSQAFVFDASGADAHLTGITSDTIRW